MTIRPEYEWHAAEQRPVIPEQIGESVANTHTHIHTHILTAVLMSTKSHKLTSNWTDYNSKGSKHARRLTSVHSGSHFLIDLFTKHEN